MTSFSGAWPTMLTPYNDDLSIDFGAYRAIMEWYIAHKAGGLYASCLSSEMYHLSMGERLNLIKTAVFTSGGRVPVAATGNFGDSLQDHIESCRQVAECGVDVVMLTVPSFLDSDDELEQYYLAIAEAVDAKLGFYECPVPRSFHLSPSLVGKLAHTGRFYAFKETASDLERHKEHLRAAAGTPLCLLQSNTFLVLDSTRAGATGSMTIGAIWVPDMVARVLEVALSTDPAVMQEAERLHGILCTMKLAQRYVHPWGVRYLMAMRGLPISTLGRSGFRAPDSDTVLGLNYAARLWFDEQGELKV